MENGIPDLNLARFSSWFPAMQNIFLADAFERAWQIGRDLLRGLRSEGIYEVLDYESILEIHDTKGTKATFRKVKKVRYLQDNIIAFQDYAWGDGNILINYQTNRGKPVDWYRSGYKTYILLSLRDVKNRGDIDEFNIQWDIRRGFLKHDGYWGTDVSQRMKRLKINVVFPKGRPPLRLTLEESNRRRTQILGGDNQKQLPDGRWRVMWETTQLRLYELYVLRWIW
ncbi:MAG: hypothetical protein P4L50_29130 [Anaerolineaceae bacterium]|nr:hypothetical protein [Anaerolineaceae bacterium]